MKLSDFPEIFFTFSKSSDGNMKFTQGDYQETLENRKKFLEKLNIPLSSIIDTNVQHNSEILKVTQTDLGKGAENIETALRVDVLISNEKNIYLFLTIADCLPILMYDPTKKAIALIHGGWKGLEQSIIEKAVSKMKNEFNSKPEDLVVYIGPSIGPCHYKKDLWQQAEDQLINLGVLKENIENSKICTYENEKYFSHRKADDKKLAHDYRFATILGLKQ